MNSIQDFITSAASSLGTSEDSTRSATGGILQALQGASDDSDFQQLLGKIPGSAGLLQGTESQPSSGGMLGGMLGQATSALGGSAGSLGGILSMLQGSGLGADKLGPLVTMFLEFARSKAGKDLVGRLLAKAPELAKLAG